MIKYCCDICDREVTGDDAYIVVEEEIICSRECGYKWIDEQFKAEEG